MADNLSNVCEDFHLDPSRNPRTGKLIKEGGPVYRKLMEECTEEGAVDVRPRRGLFAEMDLDGKCDEFRRDPSRNPTTGRPIKIDGPIYKKLIRECGEETEDERPRKRDMSPEEKCDEFRRDPSRNPITGKTIKVGGPVYRKLEKECSPPEDTFSEASDTDFDTDYRIKLQRKRGMSRTERCAAFDRDPTRNPITGRPIKRDGPVYRRLVEDCEGDPETDDDVRMPPPRRVLDVEEKCDEFHRDPSVNPATGRPIKYGGPAFRKLLRECGDAEPRRRPLTSNEMCDEFRRDPTKNPITGRTIKTGGPVHTRLLGECADDTESEASEYAACPSRRQSMTSEEKCSAFLRDPATNPSTGKNIKEGGPTYNKLMRECSDDTSTDSDDTSEPTDRRRRRARNIGTREKCEEFLENPGINPETGKTIKHGGPVYTRLIKECAKPMSSSEISSSSDLFPTQEPVPLTKCQKFRQNRRHNPENGKRIKKGGPVYMRLVKECAKDDQDSLYNVETSSDNSYTSYDMDDCFAFQRNPGINPVTGKAIKIGGPKYKSLVKACGEPGKATMCNELENGACNISGGTRQISDVPSSVYITESTDASSDEDYDDTAYPLAVGKYTTVYGHSELTMAARHDFMKTVRMAVRDMAPSDKGFCVSGDRKWADNWLVSDHVVGRGSFGAVHIVQLRGLAKPVAIKESLYTSTQDKRRYRPTLVWDQWVGNSEPMESKINRLVTQTGFERQTPFVPLTAGSGTCDSCDLKLLKMQRQGRCYMQIMEPASMSLDKVLRVMSQEQGASALAQVLLGLAALQRNLGMVHYDIKAHNVLVKKTLPGGFWAIRDSFNGQTFYVPNLGYMCMLADYGVSRLVRQSVNFSPYHGIRQCRVDVTGLAGWGDNAGKEFKITPFSTQLTPELVNGVAVRIKTNKTARYWRSSENDKALHKTTYNVFSGNHDYRPSIPVDLNDMARFPAWEWRGDVSDVVRMIVGGNRVYQSGHHITAYAVSKTEWELRAEKLAKANPTYSGFVLDGTGMKYVQANTAAAYIFECFKTPPPGQQLIDRYEF
ncbi:unknown [Singapore grouper iridovirus]|uniref:Protein kinase domain-containing protein n=1 Tax=Singapore grouper iridovirus TaxID=262968 RepID=Q5YFM6_9VIRU|nr:hypothetical protein ORF039L [Singapore grouper iridovirus]AAS18054.1 unknown [Singapore grouper iridovirus]WAU86748.1 hypothetical protein ORF039L [Singapore grouper iridovirus]